MDKPCDDARYNTADLIEGYLAISKDLDREREALEWAEALIGDPLRAED